MEPKTKKDALLEFIRTISETGGVFFDEEDCACPVQAPEWLDLGLAYMEACKLLKIEPEVAKQDPREVRTYPVIWEMHNGEATGMLHWFCSDRCRGESVELGTHGQSTLSLGDELCETCDKRCDRRR